MSKNDKLRIVPARNGIALTRPWYFFSRGDEFYAASEAVLSEYKAKISFHSGGNWQFRLGTMEKKLVYNMPREGNWILALHLHFLIPNGACVPKSTEVSPDALRIEVPEDHQLQIDLWLSRSPPTKDASGKVHGPPTDVLADPNTQIYSMKLRNGNEVLICCHVPRLDPTRRRAMRSYIKEFPFMRHSVSLDYSEVFAELASFSSQPTSWNSVMVLPMQKSYFHDPTTPNPHVVCDGIPVHRRTNSYLPHRQSLLGF